VVAVLAWSTFAAGGVYLWASAPAVVASLLLAIAVRPSIGTAGSTRLLDAALLMCCGAILLQLVPLPAALVSRLTPHAMDLRSTVWLGSPGAGAAARPVLYPLTVNAAGTWISLALVAGVVLLFWTCRQVCDEGGSRQIVRAVAVIGVLASIAAIIQRAENKELIYGYWKPLDAGARPFGPFVNRNHFATFVDMACPLVLGYMVARGHSHRPRRDFAQRLVAALKQLGSTSMWLGASACVMTIALLASTSRSGTIGLTAALLTAAWLARGREWSHGRFGTALVAVLFVVAVLVFVNLNAVLLRVDETLAVGVAGRAATWRDTRAVIRDYWLTGTGLGTFPAAMLVYQPPGQMLFANQAHNQYLQLASEGGLLLVVPAALAVLAFAALVRRRLIADTSTSCWLRIGAVAGLVGVGVQGLWETGLRMPANGMLCALLAAIAVHSPADPMSSPPSR
jgi:O-antigen ligase